MRATIQALAAVRAAKHMNEWGLFATIRFLASRRVPAMMAQAAIEFEKRRKS